MKTTSPHQAFTDGLSNRLFFRLYQCANMLHKTGTRALEAQRVTTQQWAVLGALPDAGGVTVGDLAARLMVSRQNLTGVLARLEAMGLTERSVDQRDNRARLIRRTPEGQARWLAMQPAIAGFYAGALEGFSHRDMIAMLAALDKLLDNFRAIDAAASAQHLADDAHEDT